MRPMAYLCKNAVRMRGVNYLICKRFQRKGVDYTDSHNAIQAICPRQKFCRDYGHNVNTDDARGCKWLLAAPEKDE